MVFIPANNEQLSPPCKGFVIYEKHHIFVVGDVCQVQYVCLKIEKI